MLRGVTYDMARDVRPRGCADPDYTELIDNFREVRRMVDENPQAWSSLPK